jgi:hypothetical protein
MKLKKYELKKNNNQVNPSEHSQLELISQTHKP